MCADKPKIAAIYGSRRPTEDDVFYQSCMKLSHKLARQGYVVRTGGGSGIMEAANRGAFSVSPECSQGVSLQQITDREPPNSYLGSVSSEQSFSERKRKIAEGASLAIFYPGSTGTFDEFFDLLDVIKCGLHSTLSLDKNIQVFCVGRSFWEALRNFHVSVGLVFPDFVNIIDTGVEGNFVTSFVDASHISNFACQRKSVQSMGKADFLALVQSVLKAPDFKQTMHHGNLHGRLAGVLVGSDWLGRPMTKQEITLLSEVISSSEVTALMASQRNQSPVQALANPSSQALETIEPVSLYTTLECRAGRLSRRALDLKEPYMKSDNMQTELNKTTGGAGLLRNSKSCNSIYLLHACSINQT